MRDTIRKLLRVGVGKLGLHYNNTHRNQLPLPRPVELSKSTELHSIHLVCINVFVHSKQKGLGHQI